jgi:hypothetical protein
MVRTVRSDYMQLRSLWVDTAKRAENLNPVSRAVVFRYLISAAEYTAPFLDTHGNDPDAAKNAEEYAKRMRGQDVLSQGYRLADMVGPLFGFGSAAGLALGCGAGILSLFAKVGEAGAQVDLKPLVAKLLATSGVVAFLLRVVVNTGPLAGKAIADVWNTMLSSVDPAKQLVTSILDKPETTFYAGLNVPRPSRVILDAAGPGVAIGVMILIALPIALVSYFLFSSFTAVRPPATFHPF